MYLYWRFDIHSSDVLSLCVCCRDERKNFIRAKYERKRYAIITCTNVEDRKLDLKQAVLLKDLLALLQVYAEGIDFMDPLPDCVSSVNSNTVVSFLSLSV